MSHTPAPWRVLPVYGTYFSPRICADEEMVAEIIWTPAPATRKELLQTDPLVLEKLIDARRKADASLIAAAPDLLDALRTIAAAPTIGGISAGERKGLERAAVIARAAIAKASAS